MGIVIAPAFSVDASGNIGGLNFTRWRGKNIARSINPGTQPNTQLQQDQQARLTASSSAWGSTLTQANRDRWNEAAKTLEFIDRLGTKWEPAGYHYFMKVNTQRQVMGLSIAVEPVHDSKILDASELRLDRNGWSNDVEVNFLSLATGVIDDFVDADKYQIFRAGPFVSPARNPIEGEWRQIAIHNAGTAYDDLDLDWGVYYWYRVRGMLNSGLVGNYFEAQTDTIYNGLAIPDATLYIDHEIGITGDPVTDWVDQSGEGNDYSATGTQRPDKTSTGVDFNGTANYMTNLNAFMTSPMWQRTQNFTAIFVIKPQANAGVESLLGMDGSGDAFSTGRITMLPNNLYDLQLKDRIGVGVRDNTNRLFDLWISDNSAEYNVNQLNVITIRQNANVIEICINSANDNAVHSIVNDISGGSFSNIATILGGQLTAGPTSELHYDGEVQEGYVWAESITDDQLGKSIDFLKDKYSI